MSLLSETAQKESKNGFSKKVHMQINLLLKNIIRVWSLCRHIPNFAVSPPPQLPLLVEIAGHQQY